MNKGLNACSTLTNRGGHLVSIEFIGKIVSNWLYFNRGTK